MRMVDLSDPGWSWTRKSQARFNPGEDSIIWSCVGGSDYWRLTASGVIAHNGHARTFPVEGDFSLEGLFSAPLASRYDQVGLVIISNPSQWFKASFEVDGQTLVGGVYTRETSDWSLAPATLPGALRVVRSSATVELSWRPSQGAWARLRQFSLEGLVSVGVYSASPLGPGFQAGVSGFRLSVQ